MTGFICLTQESPVTGFRGPSGNTYTSQQGEIFMVENIQDVEYFESKKGTFKHVGALERALRTKDVQIDSKQEMKNYLQQFKLSIEEVDACVEFYECRDDITSAVERDGPYPPELTEKSIEKMKELILEPTFPKDLGNGYFELSDGNKIKGKLAAEKAEKKLGGK